MSARAKTAGFTIMIAIFLIIVLAALGAAAVTLSKTEQTTGTRSLAAARVYYGAKAGLEWGIQQAIAPAAPVCATSTNFNLTQGALAGINVTVECSPSTHGVAGCAPAAGCFVYYIRSCATTSGTCTAAATVAGPLFGSDGYAERRLEATVSNIP